MSENRKGKHLSDETKRKISLAHRGKTYVMTERRREQILQAQKLTLTSHQKGVKHTWGKKISLGLKDFYTHNASKNIGRKLTVEHRQKVSKGLKGHTTSEETRRKIGCANSANFFITCFYCGKKKRVKPSTQRYKRRFCSNPCYWQWRRENELPSEHNNWKGGVSKDLKRYRQRREAIERTGGELPIERIQMVYEDNIKEYGTLTCYLCLKPIEFGRDSLEHKTPLIRGGTNQYSNLAVAHRNCNSRKGKKTFEEWKEGKGMKDLIEVKLDAVGKAATAYMKAKNVKAKATDDCKAAEEALILELHKAKRNSIILDNCTLKVQIISAKEKIVIK